MHQLPSEGSLRTQPHSDTLEVSHLICALGGEHTAYPATGPSPGSQRNSGGILCILWTSLSFPKKFMSKAESCGSAFPRVPQASGSIPGTQRELHRDRTHLQESGRRQPPGSPSPLLIRMGHLKGKSILAELGRAAAPRQRGPLPPLLLCRRQSAGACHCLARWLSSEGPSISRHCGQLHLCPARVRSSGSHLQPQRSADQLRQW